MASLAAEAQWRQVRSAILCLKTAGRSSGGAAGPLHSSCGFALGLSRWSDGLSVQPHPCEQPFRVVVLMSTFNGQRYVAAQLQSILAQLPAGGRIDIRDDGSSDGTVDVIRGLNDARISLTIGSNCGFGSSFLTLLAAVPADADLVMFADQDDIWLPCKVDRAWSHLKPLAGRPGLYGSAQILVDAELRPLQVTPPWPRAPSLANALTENIITGCTAALNRPALKCLQSAGLPSGVYFHDWWLYLVISAFGDVIFDEVPTLLYRQHGRNQIGHGIGWFGRQAAIVRFLLRHDWVGILLRQVCALRRHYGGDLGADRLAAIERQFVFGADGAEASWRLIFSPRRRRQRARDELPLRVLLAAHKLRLWPLPGWRLAAQTKSRADA